MRSTLSHTPLFSSPDEPRLRLLVDRTRSRRFGGGNVVHEAGDPADGLYVIATGEAAVSSGFEGHEVEINRCGEVAFFGETTILTNQPRWFARLPKANCG